MGITEGRIRIQIDHISSSKVYEYSNSRKYRVENNYPGTLSQEEISPSDASPSVIG